MLAFLMILFSAWHHADSPFCLYLYGQSPLTCQVFQAPGTKQDSPSISVLHCVGLLTWLYFLGAQSQEIPLSVCFWDLAKLSGFPSQNRFLSLSLMVGVCLPRKAFLAPSGKHIPLSVFVLDGGGGHLLTWWGLLDSRNQADSPLCLCFWQSGLLTWRGFWGFQHQAHSAFYLCALWCRSTYLMRLSGLMVPCKFPFCLWPGCWGPISSYIFLVSWL